MSDNLTGLANAKERPNLHYHVVRPDTGKKYPPHSSRGWIYGRDRMAELIADGRILWPKSPTGRPRLKRYLSDMKNEKTGFSSLLDAPANVEGTKVLAALLGEKVFAFPKPPGLLEILIGQVTERDSLVLDSFSGSGTTGQAVMNMNMQDGGARKFILIEMDENICQNVTSQRLRNVIEGYLVEKNGIKEQVSGLGGGFRFCRMGGPLFDEAGNIRGSVTFADLAAHIYFMETGSPLHKRAKAESPLLGVHEGRAVYLLYNGALGDKKPEGGNVLTGDVLESLPSYTGPKVIYGEACRLGGSRLLAGLITFKQIPYQIKVN